MKMQVITTKATIKKEVRKTLKEIEGFNKKRPSVYYERRKPSDS